MRKRKTIFQDIDEARSRMEREQYALDKLDESIQISSNTFLRRLNEEDLPAEPEGDGTGDKSPAHMSDKEFAKFVRETILEQLDNQTLTEFAQTLANKAIEGDYPWARLFLRMLVWLVPSTAVEQLETPKGVAIVIENYGEGGKTERNSVVL